MYHFSDKYYQNCFICKRNKPKLGWVILISNRKECYCSNNCFYNRYRISNLSKTKTTSIN